MEWTQDKILKFIDLYKDNPCLWYPQNTNFKSNSVKNDAWTSISSNLGCGTIEAKKKMESLMASFRRERQKSQMGAATEEKYTSKWFAYKRMFFLMEKYKDRETENTINIPETSQASVESNMQNVSLNTQDESKHQLKKRKAMEDPRVQEALDIMSSVPYPKSSARDPSEIFGEHVAAKHRKYSEHVKNVVEHLITNILFEADMGKYDSPVIESKFIPSTCSTLYQP